MNAVSIDETTCGPLRQLRVNVLHVETESHQRAASRRFPFGCSPCRRDLESFAYPGSSPGFFCWIKPEGYLRSDRHSQKYGTPLSETSGARRLPASYGSGGLPDRSTTVADVGARQPGSDAASSRTPDPLGVVEVNSGNRQPGCSRPGDCALRGCDREPARIPAFIARRHAPFAARHGIGQGVGGFSAGGTPRKYFEHDHVPASDAENDYELSAVPPGTRKDPGARLRCG